MHRRVVTPKIKRDFLIALTEGTRLTGNHHLDIWRHRWPNVLEVCLLQVYTSNSWALFLDLIAFSPLWLRILHKLWLHSTALMQRLRNRGESVRN